MPASRDKDRPALSPWRGRRGGTIYARATPEKAEITETYEVTQNISVNPRLAMGGAHPGPDQDSSIPLGRENYSSPNGPHGTSNGRWARTPSAAGRDVMSATCYSPGNEHIVLPRDVSMRGDYGVLDLKVPAAAAGDLTADRKGCVISHEYQVSESFPSSPRPSTSM